jgi:hypothetical protein
MILLDRRPGSATLGAYIEADTSAKVGFRPMHTTDAFGAAHLSGYGSGFSDAGLGEYSFNRPFDPWELYADVQDTAGMHGVFDGLGQGHNPFTPRAWQLHGLGYMGAAADDVVAQAADELVGSGHITTAEHDAILEGSMSFQDVLGYDPTDSSSWSSLTTLFREVNQDLISLEQAIGSNPAAAQAIGRDLIAKRTEYGALATQFVRYYTMLMGSAPSGLSGLGVAPMVWVAGAAVFIVGAFIALYALRDWSKSIDVSHLAAQSSGSTQAALVSAMQKAQAAGDTVTATTIAKQLAQVGGAPASSFESWFMSNAKWIGLGMGAIVILPGLIGGKRR